MTTYYNNLPQESVSSDAATATLQAFDAYSTAPLSIDSATFDAMTGFFASRGFGEDGARSMAYVIIKQAILDKYNPFELLETLRGLNDIELSGLITEILNYNRYKTSSLGTATPFEPSAEIARNIVA